MNKFNHEERHVDPYNSQEVELPVDKIVREGIERVHLPENDLRPGSDFAFGGDVAEHFEEKVLPKQVPGYLQMRLRCAQIGVEFIRPDSDVIDLGTSHATVIRDLITSAIALKRPELVDTVTYVGIETEDEMIAQARQSVSNLFSKIDGHNENDAERIVQILNRDLRFGLPHSQYKKGYSLVTSILTLQFIPIEHRMRLVEDIYDQLLPGGAFILIEKVLGNGRVIDDLLTKTYYDDKRREGIDEDAIFKKRESLEGFLVPQSSQANRHLLEQSGFSSHNIDCFWRDLQFEALIAIKR